MSNNELDGIYFLEHCDFDANNRLIPLPEDVGTYGLVLVFAHWCGNCKYIKPEFRKLLDQVKGKVRLYALNGTGNRGDNPSLESEQQLMKRWSSIVKPKCEFRGFPSVYLFSPQGDVIGEFNDERKAEHLMKFLRTHIKDL